MPRHPGQIVELSTRGGLAQVDVSASPRGLRRAVDGAASSRRLGADPRRLRARRIDEDEARETLRRSVQRTSELATSRELDEPTAGDCGDAASTLRGRGDAATRRGRRRREDVAIDSFRRRAGRRCSATRASRWSSVA